MKLTLLVVFIAVLAIVGQVRADDDSFVELSSDPTMDLSKMTDLAKELGAEVVSATDSENESHQSQDEDHSLVESEAEAGVESHLSASQEAEVAAELADHTDVHDFLPSSLLSVLDSIEAETKLPAKELDYPELRDTYHENPHASSLEAETPASFLEVGGDIQNDPYTTLDLANGGKSQDKVSARGVDMYVASHADDVNNDVRPVPPPKHRYDLDLKPRFVPHASPVPQPHVKDTSHLTTLSVYEAAYEGPEFAIHQAKVAAAKAKQNAATAFLALEASAPRFDSSGRWIPEGSVPPVVPDWHAAAIPTINAIPYGFRGNLRGGYSSLEPRFPALKPKRPAKDGPPQSLHELLPIRADIVDDLTPFKAESAPTNWD